MLKGSINHLSLTVSDLPKAMEFFVPFLKFLGYIVDGSGSSMVRVNLSPITGGALNIWQAKEAFKGTVFEVYAPGLHHVCFNVESKSQIDGLARLVPAWGGRVTDPPGEYPYTDRGTYYAVYFRGPDNIKFECVYMSELRRLHETMGTLGKQIWSSDEK
jgi:catechol 2,3-dioxygenase-like lactoylglutathione lyase family enzyme